MRRELPLCRLSLIALVWASVGAYPLLAQEDDPFAPAGPSAAALQELRSESPLARDPQTPVELLEAVVTMVDIGRTDLAVQYLDRLTRGTLSEETLLELRDAVGTAALLKLDQVPELRSLIAPLIERSNDAMRLRAGRAERIAEMLQALRGSPEDRSAALAEFRSLGPLAVPTLIGIVAADDDDQVRDDVGAALIEAGSFATPMLAAALQAPEPRVRQFAADVLGRLRSVAAVPDLYYLAFGPTTTPELRTSAQHALQRILSTGRRTSPRSLVPIANEALAKRLMKSARDALRQQPPLETDPQGLVDDWEWNDELKTVAVTKVTPERAATRAGARHARRALELTPDDFQARALDLTLALAEEVRPESVFQPLSDQPESAASKARAAGPSVLAEVLREGLAVRRPEIAATAARFLGELREPVALTPSGERVSPLLAALDDPDLRVQFAAAQAILKIGPKSPYRGGRRVVEILKQAVHSNSGRPHAIVGEVSTGRGGEISGMLKELGFETLVAMSGKEVFRAAAERSDAQLIVLHPNIIRWPLTETLANLRTDSRTARIPVVINGPSRLAERFQHPLPGQTPVTYATMSESPADFAFQIQGILNQIRRDSTTPRQQQLMREEAIAALGQLAAEGNNRVYDLVGTEEALAWAAAEPRYAVSALETLGLIGTRQAQNLIAEFILNSPVNDTTNRAREILDAHVSRNGLLLKRTVVDQLHAGTGVTLAPQEP